MATAVFRSHGCLQNKPETLMVTTSTPATKSTRKKPPPRPRKQKPGLVMEEVVILKRGQPPPNLEWSRSAKSDPKLNKNYSQPEADKLVKPREIPCSMAPCWTKQITPNPETVLALPASSMSRIGPDRETVPLFAGLNLYAGPNLLSSPSPSSLPLPARFLIRKNVYG